MAEEEVKVVKEKKPKKVINMEKGSPFYTGWNIVEAIILVVGGILAMVYSNNTDLQATILYIIGAFLIIDGALRILVNFLPVLTIIEKTKLTFDLVIAGSFEVALGITTICDLAIEKGTADTIIKFVAMFVGIALLVFGAILIIYSTGLLTNKLIKMTKVAILGYILAACLIALGIVSIIYLKDETNFRQVVLIIAGLVLVLAGVGQVISTIFARKKYLLKQDIRKAKEELKSSIFEENADSNKNEETIDASSNSNDEVNIDSTNQEDNTSNN